MSSMAKTVLITGATSGIGKATAELFALNGYRLILTGRRTDRLENLSSSIKAKAGVDVFTLSFDVRDRAQTLNAIDSLPDTWKNVDILVNNAGLAVGLNTIDKGDVDDWETMIDTNVKGLLYITRAVIPLIEKSKSGHIINIGSVAGKEVYLNGNVYCATKHAVDALSKAMRIDLLPKNIKVTSINPGMVDTEFSLVRFKGDQERADNVYKGLQPLTAKDIAETIFWCATRPPHVNINDLIITPTVQANATTVIRK
jgi:NADP-dependent 3-hydroxy acid dehydrogenase YdfG